MHKYNLVSNINQIKMFDSYLKCSSIKYGNINQTDLIPLVPLGSKMKDEIAFTKIVYLCISVFNVSASGMGTFEMALSVRCYGAVVRLLSKILTPKIVTS